MINSTSPRAHLALFGILMASCEGAHPHDDPSWDFPPLQATSAHFRYHARSTEKLPAGIMERLERRRTEMQTYLGVSDERITDYYLFDSAEDMAANSPCQLDCADRGRVFTTAPFQEHELNHIDFEAIATPGQTLLVEGAATAFRCAGFDPIIGMDPVRRDWPSVVTQETLGAGGSDLYVWGFRLVRHLVAEHGIARFVEYYRRMGWSSDPAHFAIEFQRYWGEPFDSVWQKLASELAAGPKPPICPCTAPLVPGIASTVSITWPWDYLVIPSGRTAVIDASQAKTPVLSQCFSESLPLYALWFQERPPGVLVARPGTDGAYVAAESGSWATRTGDWIQESCAAAPVLEMPAGTPSVTVDVPPAGTWYLRLKLSRPVESLSGFGLNVLAGTSCAGPFSDRAPSTDGEVVLQLTPVPPDPPFGAVELRP